MIETRDQHRESLPKTMRKEEEASASFSKRASSSQLRPSANSRQRIHFFVFRFQLFDSLPSFLPSVNYFFDPALSFRFCFSVTSRLNPVFLDLPIMSGRRSRRSRSPSPDGHRARRRHRSRSRSRSCSNERRSDRGRSHRHHDRSSRHSPSTSAMMSALLQRVDSAFAHSASVNDAVLHHLRSG